MQGHKDAPEVNGRIIALDIGGTFIKSGVLKGSDIVELPPAAVDSSASSNVILDAIASTVAMAADGAAVSGLGISVPGPFDYANGISLMKHKFVSLYGLDLKAELERRFGHCRKIEFRHDAVSFLAGTLLSGEAGSRRRVLGVTLGTGIGVATSFDGVMRLNDLGSPAPDTSLWDKPYRDGTVEDSISARALISRYRRSNPSFDVSLGVKGIDDDARHGSQKAQTIFAELGRDLAAVLSAHAKTLLIERIMLGGQISNAFDLFGPSLLASVPGNVDIKVSKLGGKAILLGAVEELAMLKGNVR